MVKTNLFTFPLPLQKHKILVCPKVLHEAFARVGL